MVNKWTKSPKGWWSNVNSSPRGMDDDQSCIQMDEQPKSPTGGQKTKLTYKWMVQSIVIPKMEGQRPKFPMGGQKTKVTYGGQSKVKSSLRENNNDQSHLHEDRATYWRFFGIWIKIMLTHIRHKLTVSDKAIRHKLTVTCKTINFHW